MKQLIHPAPPSTCLPGMLAGHFLDRADITNVESNISAGGTVTIGTPGALTLDGATVSGARVEVDAGSLDIISRQDTSTFDSKNKSVGLSVNVSPGGAVSGSANFGKGKQSGDFNG